MATANKIYKVSDRVERAKSFLLTQFHDKPNINAFVDVVVTELQELENALTDMQDVRTLKGSYGVYLDEIGRKLKVDRGNYADNDYKTAIKIAMAKKTSSATAEDILYIVNLLTNDDTLRLENNYPYLLELTGYLFCVADDPAGLKAISDLFPINTRVRLIQQYGKSFKFGTSGRGFGSGSTLNNLAFYDYGVDEGRSFVSSPTVIEPPAIEVSPFVISVPFISGNGEEGSTLLLSQGEYGGDAPITLTYQWLRDGVDIVGETSDTYLVDAIDLGVIINCKVIATNSVGNISVETNTIQISSDPFVASAIKDNLGVLSEFVYAFAEATPVGNTATASLQFLSDGTLIPSSGGSWQWLNTTGVGLGSDYQISYVVVSGDTFTNLNPNVPHTLSSNITFAKSIVSDGTGGAIDEGTYIFTIRSISNPDISESVEVTLSAEIIDNFS
jgi:hypothetical protein